MATFIVFIIVVLLVTIFSIQNSMVVGISFLFWRFEASLAIVIFLSALAGIIIALFFFLWLKMKKSGKQVVDTHINKDKGHIL
ncbi:MAG TPA: LapA family protein [Syntrophorhabdaceae bacterium]|nr:LapA family protein [Syntrophorhabdaceae bacterium]HOL05991.1 LapA family protein [Syntrophorhabdaceae bacterium]HOT42282.1 LapA family protein [Syntrophorhabdaceae bacterium]HPC66979.1 LapA family protein [Syntrophorhabdaceae bacterium]HQH43684.1 LapA family protein [Syntrophorhabdaceae bacterium]